MEIQVLEKTDEQTKILRIDKGRIDWLYHHKFEKPVEVGKVYHVGLDRGYYYVNGESDREPLKRFEYTAKREVTGFIYSEDEEKAHEQLKEESYSDVQFL